MKKILTVIVLFLFAVASPIFAQTKVSGIVVDKSKQPIPFANVVFKNSSTGTVTNEDGRFYIESPNTYTNISNKLRWFFRKRNYPYQIGQL